MDAARLTVRSQEVLGEAQALAVRMGHSEVDGEHLLAALLDQEDGLVPRLVERVGLVEEPGCGSLVERRDHRVTEAGHVTAKGDAW